MLPHLLTRRRTLVAAFCFLAYGLACTQAPLFNTLGYEFASLTGIFTALAAWPLFSRWIESFGGTMRPLSLFFALASLLELLLLIPLAVLVVNASFVRNCSLLTGALFYLLIPCLTAPAAAAFAVFLGRYRKRFRPLLYGLLCAYLLLLPLLQIFFQPQLYAYNHIFGLFVGFSWDESQPVLATLALYRVITVGYVILFLSLAAAAWNAPLIRDRTSGERTPAFRAAMRRFAGLPFRIEIPGEGDLSDGGERTRERRNRLPAFIMTVPALVILLWGYVSSDELGFTTSSGFVERRLGGHMRTEHFDIYYDPVSLEKGEAEEVAEEHEFRLRQVMLAMRAGPRFRYRSYIYPNRELKKRLLGTETSEISRPWLGEIHLSAEGWRGSLKHELVHLVAAEFAPYIFRAPVLRYLGLTEGLAMAVEWEYGNRTLHQYAANLRRYGLLPSLTAFLTTRGFLDNPSQLSYIASGSFCRWIIDSRGFDFMRRAYAQDDAALFGDLPKLEREWHDFLDAGIRAGSDSLATLYMFKGQSLFRKICPRVVSDLNRQAAAMRRRGNVERALRLYEESDAASPNAAAAFGIAVCNYLSGNYEAVISQTDRLFADTSRAYTVAPLHLTRGDAAWMQGDGEEARRCYTLLVRESLYASATEDAAMRLEIMKEGRDEEDLRNVVTARARSSAQEDSLEKAKRELLGSIVRREPDYFLPRVLLAESLIREPDSSDAVLTLLADPPPETPFLRATLLMRGRAYLRKKMLVDALAQYQLLLRSARTESERDDALDRIERCEWKRGLPGPVLHEK